MSRRARVTAAYATVKLLDPVSGTMAVRGFYRDAITPTEADAASVEALVRRGYAEWFDDDPPETAAVRQRTAEDKAAEDAAARQLEDAAAEKSEAGGESAEPGERPKPYASKEAWLAYAISQRDEGVSEQDAAEALADKTKADLIAEFGG